MKDSQALWNLTEKHPPEQEFLPDVFMATTG